MNRIAGKKNFFQTLIGFGIIVSGCIFSLPNLPAAAETARNVDEQVFFNKVRKLIHRRGMGAIQFQTYKNIINYWNEHPKLMDRRWLAYVMATAYHETQLKPVREGFKKTDAASRRYVNWMWRKRIITLPYHRADRVTGHVYYGRGYVQLTWAENYKKMGRAIGMGDKLYRNPDLVLKPEIASKILFVGMVKGKFRYSKRTAPRGWQKLKMFFGNNKANWYRARNIINGDLRKNGNRIAGYGRKYAKAIRFKVAPDTPPVVDEGFETPGAAEGEVTPTLPGANVADADQGQQSETPVNTPAEGEAPSGGTPTEESAQPEVPSEIEDQPLDTAGEVLPSLPEEGEIIPEPVAEEPTAPTLPATDVTSELPTDGEPQVNPITIEETETVGPEMPGEIEDPVDPEISIDPEMPTQPAVPTEPEAPLEPVTPSQPEAPLEPTAPPESTAPKPEILNPVEDNSWWGSVKSFLAKYRGYVWKY